MPRIRYLYKGLGHKARAKIAKANEIILEYRAKGLDLTLRQLYYQFVARNLIANNEREYKNLGKTIADGRMIGLIDWEAIIDRTRFIRRNSHWGTPQELIKQCEGWYQIDKWARQDNYVEVFIEKDALIGVVEQVCEQNDVPYLACRGYASMSEIWRAGRYRMKPRLEAGKKVTVLYLGDHDPSGLDMGRDIEQRLQTFAEGRVELKRIALNWDPDRRVQTPAESYEDDR